jgi:hypothetical protein
VTRSPSIRRVHRAVTAVGAGLLLIGAVLVGGVAVAASSGPSISVTPHSRLSADKEVVVTGTGFAHHSAGAVLECNPTPGEPATVVAVHDVTHLIPVGCTDPVAATTSGSGVLRPTTLSVRVGSLGGWETGIDSAGNPADSDQAAYPCPPTPSQAALGVSCDFTFLDNKGQQATSSVAFRSSGKPPPTTTTTVTTTTTTTTTTPGECIAEPATATAAAGDGSGAVTVAPATCLLNGTEATVSATGLYPKSGSNYLGTVLECNSDPAQPTINLLGAALPVSCTEALADTWTPNAEGTFTGVFDIVEGVTGPPASGTDSAGNPGSVDAADYPCPPTPAQESLGDTCLVVLSDSGGDQVKVPISFNPNVAPPTSTRRRAG